MYMQIRPPPRCQRPQRLHLRPPRPETALVMVSQVHLYQHQPHLPFPPQPRCRRHHPLLPVPQAGQAPVAVVRPPPRQPPIATIAPPTTAVAVTATILLTTTPPHLHGHGGREVVSPIDPILNCMPPGFRGQQHFRPRPRLSGETLQESQRPVTKRGVPSPPTYLPILPLSIQGSI